MMKISFLSIIVLLCSGCVIGTSNEIKVAEKILNQFECKNIESVDLNHSAITSFHERTLSVSKDKAVFYVDSYKSGNILFNIPLDQVVQQQYDIYKLACESLGGVEKNKTSVE